MSMESIFLLAKFIVQSRFYVYVVFNEYIRTINGNTSEEKRPTKKENLQTKNNDGEKKVNDEYYPDYQMSLYEVMIKQSYFT